MRLALSIKKHNKRNIFAAVFCALILCGAIRIAAQDVEVKIKLLPASSVRIEGRFLNSKNIKAVDAISFLRSYADVENLAERVENLELFDEGGKKLEARKSAAGEYQSAKPAFGFAYDVKIAELKNPAAKAHASWLAEDQGLLMLDDLLPQWKTKTSGRIVFEFSGDWKITTGETGIGAKTFAVADVEKAIFLVGKNQREKTVRINKTNLDLAISGEWKFSDAEAFEMATSILTEYRRMFGEIPSDRIQIFVLPFSQTPNSDRWRAETRGRTVTLISGALPSKREALQRLHEQLRHEIFHLWIPNAVNLTGNYDWFYEGFTIYQALRTGVELNQIRFEDYLNTLSRAFDLAKNQNVSLVEMSNTRWTGTNNSVYAKGMIAAFLCDLAMLDQSGGKHSLTEIFQKLYRTYHASNTKADGSRAVIEILQAYPELQPIVKKYIEGAEKIELTSALAPFGIEISENDGAARLKVSSPLGGRQKDLLNKLGYNQWRKLLRH